MNVGKYVEIGAAPSRLRSTRRPLPYSPRIHHSPCPSIRTGTNEMHGILSPSAGGGGNAGDTFPVGTILAYKGAITNIPEKWHLCDGSSGTPNLTGRFLEGVTASPGNMKSAGLPNITGNAPDVRIRCGSKTVMAGALKSWQSTGKKLIYNGGAETAGMDFDFDASRCSSVYRNDCTTVQPASYTVLYIMKIKA